MDIIESTLDILVPKVYAQNYDETAQPTFGIIDGGQTGGSQAQVNITTDSTSLRVGNEFTVDIELDTAGIPIKQYDIVLNFDASRLSVIDADSGVSGTQIEFLDSIFQVGDGDNLVSGGQVRLRAITASGNALEVDSRVIASITFQAQQNGSTVISPAEGINGLKIVNASDISIPPSVNSLTLDISARGNNQSTTSRPSSQTSQTTSQTTSSTPTTGVEQIPNTGIAEDTIAALPYILGTIFILLGAKLFHESKPKENKSK